MQVFELMGYLELVYTLFVSFWKNYLYQKLSRFLRVHTVVWNPWEKKAKAMADLGDEDYKEFVCVEAAVVETPITINPSEEWRAAQELSIVSSS